MSKLKFMSRNPHTYSNQIQVESTCELRTLQTYLWSKYGICYDYDFPPRTAPGEEWYNPNWCQEFATYDHCWKKMSSDIIYFAHVEDFAHALLLINKAKAEGRPFDAAVVA
jgi:hypothetical protein